MPTDTTADSSALIISRFDRALHDRSAFSCGFSPIDNFLKSSLSDHMKVGLVMAWIATTKDDPAVLGFYTLGALGVRPDFGPKTWQRAKVPDIPVIYLRAVAVRKDMQGKGLGTALVIDAMKRCIGIAGQMGAAAIVLDVLEDEHFERRAKFYAALGFKPLGDPDNPRRVFIPMADVLATLR
ncbi:GNAT family N-acetyltransferase [Phaeovulum sp.]|uniref:GNAT family N-acetyltransferase n=1 Tax=Phaeovulum sp. TaxID=2934796 RepID=UPI0027300FA6|nr:GNAT family N-acetyltransferase [Phaeovulum sp.]MDP1669702.1 GNAT family N-acetyltransferase [Phaeovulum sp.]MDZ4117812.1 GNAT family N-acetyltransferase [Phaeovulum sp.]